MKGRNEMQPQEENLERKLGKAFIKFIDNIKELLQQDKPSSSQKLLIPSYSQESFDWELMQLEPGCLKTHKKYKSRADRRAEHNAQEKERQKLIGEAILIVEEHNIMSRDIVMAFKALRESLFKDIGLNHQDTVIANLIIEGMTKDEISTTLTMPESTVRSHIQSIYRKSNVRSRRQLIKFFYAKMDLCEEGWGSKKEMLKKLNRELYEE